MNLAATLGNHTSSSYLKFNSPFSIVSSVFLPETAEEKLPQTVEEAEDFGIGQPLLTIPFLLRRKRKAET